MATPETRVERGRAINDLFRDVREGRVPRHWVSTDEAVEHVVDACTNSFYVSKQDVGRVVGNASNPNQVSRNLRMGQENLGVDWSAGPDDFEVEPGKGL